MKRFIRTAFLMTTVLSIFAVVPGCSNDSSGTGTGVVGAGVGAPGYTGGVVVPTPGGGVQISFSGSNVYNSGSEIAAGQVSGYGGSCGYVYGRYACTYSGNFSSGYATWLFGNPGLPTTGTLAIGGGGLPVGAAGTITYTGDSRWEPGASVTLVATTPVASYTGYSSVQVSQSVQGVITLPPSFIQNNFGGSMPAIQGIAIDFVPTTTGASGGTYRIYGGALLYTGTNASGYQSGAFIAFTQ